MSSATRHAFEGASRCMYATFLLPVLKKQGGVRWKDLCKCLMSPTATIGWAEL